LAETPVNNEVVEEITQNPQFVAIDMTERFSGNVDIKIRYDKNKAKKIADKIKKNIMEWHKKQANHTI
jgi:hypothetical protein